MTNDTKARNFQTASEGHINMAKFLAEWVADELCYLPGLGWYFWTGMVWKESEVEARLLGRKALSLRKQLIERKAEAAANAAFANPTGTTTPKVAAEAARKRVLKELQFVRLCETGSGFSSMMKFAADLLAVDDMDEHPELLNTPLGTFDMDRRELREWRREDRITQITSGKYITDPEDGSLMEQDGLFQGFLADVLPDPEDRQYVQILYGLSLYGDIKERILPVFHGRGFNGKSTLVNAMLTAAGTYGITLASNTLMAQRGSSHSTELTDLKGKRIAVFSETDTGQKINAALIKRLTSPGNITARRMRQDDITWRQSHSCFMDTNYLPRVDGGDKAAFDRLRVVEFTRDISDHKDPEMGEKLDYAEDAILTWGIHGWLMYLAHGLPTSPNVRKATSRYQQESDNVQLWLDEHTEPDSGNHELRTPLYTAYKFWSDELGEKPLSAAEFYRYLEGAGYELKGLNGKRTVKGLRLTGGAVDSFSKLFGDVPLPR